MSLEQFSRARAKKKSYEKTTGRAYNPEKSIEEPPSLADIIADPENSVLFGKLVNGSTAASTASIYEKWTRGEDLSTKEKNFLEKSRFEFAERKAEAEKMQERLSEDLMVQLSAEIPDLKHVVGHVGAERATELVQGRLAHMAMGNKKMFEKLTKALNERQKLKESRLYRLMERDVMNVCARHGLEPDTFAHLIDINDPAKSTENIRKEIKKNYGLFSNAINFIRLGGKSKYEAREAYSVGKDAASGLMAQEMQKHLKAIGDVLSLTVSNDPAVRKAVVNEALYGIRAESTSGETITTAREYVDQQKKLSEVTALKDWGKFKGAYRNAADGKKWSEYGNDAAGNTGKEEIKSAFLKQYESTHSPEGEGIFSSLLSVFLSIFIEERLEKKLS
jgi:hypothetical protein